MTTQRWLWMAVTADRFELPLAVADSMRALGKLPIVGVDSSTIAAGIKRGRNGTVSGRKFVKVLLDEEEEDEDE